MRIARYLAAAMLLWASSVPASASAPDWLNIFRTGDKTMPVKVDAMPLEDISDIAFAPEGGEYRDMVVTMADGSVLTVSMDDVERYDFGTNIPSLYLDTDPAVENITSKVDYLGGSLTLRGFGRFDDARDVEMKIRGRGNTTWYDYPKKPYRLKFPAKVSLCGLKKAKNYVLIANYIDNTLMHNAIAFKLAELAGIPFTNTCVPVNVWLNGRYDGSYMLTEKVGINGASVDIDELNSILWELDTHYDEDYKFRSPKFNLPVMVKDPDFAEIAAELNAAAGDGDGGDAADVTPEGLFDFWKADFMRMEEAVACGEPEKEIDMVQLARNMLVFLVCGNREMNHPKSVYLYKEKGGLYRFGPVWDFDWAFDYGRLAPTTYYSIWPADGAAPGTRFLCTLVESAAFREAFAAEWVNFRENLLPQLMEYFDSYAADIRVSALQDGARWPQQAGKVPQSCESYDSNVADLRAWIMERVAFIDSDPNWGFFPMPSHE